MSKTLTIRVAVRRLPLSKNSVRALRTLDNYDLVVFTSKNARKFFAAELTERHLAPVKSARVVVVGPRADLLKLSIRNKRILFPRSAIAPYDIVQQLRKRGTTVRVIPLYTTDSIPISRQQKKSLLCGEVTRLNFRSPSGVQGLVQQLSKKEQKIVCRIPAECIGHTTARTARAVGFKKVSIKSV